MTKKRHREEQVIGHLSALQRVSGNPLLRLKSVIHQRLKLIQTE